MEKVSTPIGYILALLLQISISLKVVAQSPSTNSSDSTFKSRFLGDRNPETEIVDILNKLEQATDTVAVNACLDKLFTYKDGVEYDSIKVFSLLQQLRPVGSEGSERFRFKNFKCIYTNFDYSNIGLKWAGCREYPYSLVSPHHNDEWQDIAAPVTTNYKLSKEIQKKRQLLATYSSFYFKLLRQLSQQSILKVDKEQRSFLESYRNTECELCNLESIYTSAKYSNTPATLYTISNSEPKRYIQPSLTSVPGSIVHRFRACDDRITLKELEQFRYIDKYEFESDEDEALLNQISASSGLLESSQYPSKVFKIIETKVLKTDANGYMYVATPGRKGADTLIFSLPNKMEFIKSTPLTNVTFMVEMDLKREDGKIDSSHVVLYPLVFRSAYSAFKLRKKLYFKDPHDVEMMATLEMKEDDSLEPSVNYTINIGSKVFLSPKWIDTVVYTTTSIAKNTFEDKPFYLHKTEQWDGYVRCVMKDEQHKDLYDNKFCTCSVATSIFSNYFRPWPDHQVDLRVVLTPEVSVAQNPQDEHKDLVGKDLIAFRSNLSKTKNSLMVGLRTKYRFDPSILDFLRLLSLY